MADLIVVGIVLIIVGVAIAYIVKEKKKGVCRMANTFCLYD